MAKTRIPLLTNVNEEISKPKYKRGDKVYSYANKDYEGEIATVRPSTEEGFNHAYQVILSNGKRSKWIDEPSLSDEPITESATENEIRDYFKGKKHEGEEVDDAITKTANEFKIDPDFVREKCSDILDEAKINENVEASLKNYLSGESIHGYTEDIYAIVSGDSIPGNAMDDIIEYLKENNIDKNITENEVIEKYSIPQLLDAYLGWNGISGYSEDILDIAGVDYESGDLFESKLDGSGKLKPLSLLKDDETE